MKIFQNPNYELIVALNIIFLVPWWHKFINTID